MEKSKMAEAHAKPHHDYHLVAPSPWPAIGAISTFIAAVGGITWMHHMFAADMRQLTREQLFGGVWPPKGIETFDPWHLPLLNTLILLTSGTTVTWAHHALLEDDRQGLKWGLILTIVLGLAFTCVQAYEY